MFPSILILILSMASLIYAFHCKKYFPSWHQNLETFRMHQCYLVLFCAYWVPFSAVWIYLNMRAAHDMVVVLVVCLYCSGSMGEFVYWRVLICTDLVQFPKDTLEEDMEKLQSDDYLAFRGVCDCECVPGALSVVASVPQAGAVGPSVLLLFLLCVFVCLVGLWHPTQLVKPRASEDIGWQCWYGGRESSIMPHA